MKKQGNRKLRWWAPLSLLVLLEVFKLFPEQVENWYSLGIYPGISKFFRAIFGRIPFSVGDLMVAFAIAWLLFKIIVFLAKRQTGKWKSVFSLSMAGRIIRPLLWLYIAFHLCWGLNYYRRGSTAIMHLQLAPYTAAEADTLMQQIQLRLDYAVKDSAGIANATTNRRQLLGQNAFEAYRSAAEKYPIPAFETMSLKPILLGKWQAYAGYAGYIFPFTGEAQADFYVPPFTLPFTVCHEMAHQLGFGAESEANLIGFLAAKESNNPAFVYSAYAGVHRYALRELFLLDSVKARVYIDRIPPILKKDLEAQYRFQEAHSSFLQPALDAAYTLYLQGNNQPLGLQSYNRVVAWLIAYGKKYGWESI